MHEKSAQIGVPTFADPEQFLLIPACILPGPFPSQAANSRSLRKAAPLPIAVTNCPQNLERGNCSFRPARRLSRDPHRQDVLLSRSAAPPQQPRA
jgi:hypothetical protein